MEEEPAEREKRERRRGLLVRRFTVSDLRAAVRDHYAWDELVEAIVELEELDIRDIHLPPAGTAEGRDLSLVLTNFSVKASERFGDPAVYHIGHLSLEADVPGLLATIERPRIHLPSLEYRDSRLHLESTTAAADKPEPENLQEVIAAWRNATGEKPARLREIREEKDQARRREREARRPEAPNPARLLDNALSLFQGSPESAGETAPGPETDAAPAPLPFESIHLDRLAIANIHLAMRDQRDESKNLDSHLQELEGGNLVYPPDPSVAGSLSLRATPAGQETSLVVTATGNLGLPREGHKAAMEASAVGLPMERAGEVDAGRLDSDLRATVDGRVLQGSLRLRAEGLRLRRSNAILDNLTAGPIGTALASREGITVPFRITIDDPAWRILLQGLLLEIVKELPAAALRELEGRTAGEVARELERLGRELEVGGDRLREELNRLESLGRESLPAGEKVEDAIRDAGSMIEGIFGRRNREGGE